MWKRAQNKDRIDESDLLIMKDTGYRRKTPQFESSQNQKNDKVGARNIKEVTK